MYPRKTKLKRQKRTKNEQKSLVIKQGLMKLESGPLPCVHKEILIDTL
jgi:flagellar motor component MotA